jgi:MFS family permease
MLPAHFSSLLIGRFMLGVICSLSIGVAGAYLKQTFSERLRKTFGAIYSLSRMIGSEICYLLGYFIRDADTKPFYEVLHCKNPGDWVAQHVMPILNKPAISIAVFQRLLAGFLSKYNAVHIIADWPDDIRYFCQAIITGPGTCIPTPAISFEIRRDIDAGSELPHNALADAYGIAKKLKDLERYR